MDSQLAIAQNGLEQLQNHQYQQIADHGTPNDNKRTAEDGGQQGAGKRSRSRYISLACNECKRRKIKCNGQTPCQRCGNLNLECVYAPNCCNGFKDSAEYKDMANHIASLQEQVNMLYNNLSDLRTQLGHAPPSQPPQQQQQQHQHQHQQPLQQVQQIQQQSSPIDPSLHAHMYPGSSFSGAQASPGAPIAPMSPSHHRPRSASHAAQQPTFRGPTSNDFNFDVAKSTLQTMGINAATGENNGDGSGSNGEAGADSLQPSPLGSPGRQARNAQLIQRLNDEKDPIWMVSREEALRLCQVYEDEMGLMYPILDINKVTTYANKLYTFIEAMRRTGLMQQGMPGADSIDDEDTNILKMVIATALTVEASGRSDLGQRMFEYVQPAIDIMPLGNVGVNGIRLLTMTAMYEFHRDNEGTSWRIIGMTARLLIELGLHRRETYEAMSEESDRSETNLLFWAIYVLDRRWSFGTGMPFALQDSDIDPLLPRPESSPYLMAMIKYCEIGGKVWRTVASAPANTEEMSYLDYQVIQWHRSIPASLQIENPSQQGRLSTPTGPQSSRGSHRLSIILYLRTNQMRILIYRPALHSATSIMQHREQAQTVVDIAKDTIRILTHINQTTDLYRTQQVLFNAFLTSALAVLFLAVSHTPALFAEGVRDEFYMALDLVRGFSKGSFVSKRLWRTIRVLKEVAPKLGLALKPDADVNSNQAQQQQQTIQQASTSSSHQRTGSKTDDIDPSRSAAVAMAGLAGHNVDDLAIFGTGPNGAASWASATGNSSSPEGMANDLTSLFEAAGGLQAIGQQGHGGSSGQNQNGGAGVALQGGQFGMPDGTAQQGAGVEGMEGIFGGEEGLSNILKELF